MELKCSQREFAERYDIELRTLQNWEQGERLLDNSSRTLIKLIENDPDGVRSTLETDKGHALKNDKGTRAQNVRNKKLPEMAD
jgi:transcriptional regulator with XRE-family HTH domain